MSITRAQQAKQMLQNGGRIGLRGGGADMGGVAGASRGPAGGQTRGDFASDRGRDPMAQFGPSRSSNIVDEVALTGGGVLSDEARKALEAQRRRARGEITPSTRFRNRLISGIISSYIPFGGRIYSNMIDQRAMGFSSPKREIVETITDNDNDNSDQVMAQLFTPYQKDFIEDKAKKLSPIELAIQERDQMGGPRLFAAEGGIMDLEQAREGYKLGKLVGKIGRAIKKIGKSKVGKAALTAAATFKLGGGKFSNLFRGEDTGFSLDNIPFMPSDRKDQLALAASGALVAAPFIFGEDDSQSEYEKFLAQRGGQGIDIPGIRAKPYDTLARAFVAEGGKPEPVATKTMPLLDMGGKEMDLRDEGGFVPIGRMEKADDVPARLSKNEFVFTADAVRNAGDGNVDKGAEVMYNMMKNLEAGGDVSEESQGLEGARKMFQTSQRLEEVL